MIIEWLGDLIEAGLTWLASLFPSTSWDPLSGLSGALGFVGGLNYFLPVSELFSALFAFLTVGAAFGVVTLVLWVVAFIRGGSSVG